MFDLNVRRFLEDELLEFDVTVVFFDKEESNPEEADVDGVVPSTGLAFVDDMDEVGAAPSCKLSPSPWSSSPRCPYSMLLYFPSTPMPVQCC